MTVPVIALTPPQPEIVCVVTERFAFGDSAHHLATLKHNHGATPFQRPVSAASMQSAVDPNHASMPMIAGR